MDPYRYDDFFRTEGRLPLAGVDEAGRGPLAGPVVASAVVLSSDVPIGGLRDSKTLTRRQREDLFWDIICIAEDFGVGIIEPEEIDRTNIYRATVKAMSVAVRDLQAVPRLLVIDAVRLPLQIEQISIPKAESISASVAAASILAKVTRDRLMDFFHQIYPVYGFDQHKGYATKVHLEMLRLHGPCPIHRKTFSPVSMVGLPL